MLVRCLATLVAVLLCSSSSLAFEYATKCKKNEVLFLHRCFCEPGWENASTDPKELDCSFPYFR
jgi:hypothetical protein